MFTLAETPAEPYWLDLPQGVRLKVRPITQVIANAASVHAVRQFEELAAAQAEQRNMGILGEDALDLADPDIREAITNELWAAGLARHGIIAWEGVGNAEGTDDEKCTPDTRARFGRSPLAGAFLALYHGPLRRVRAEGNASAPGPSGNSDPGANTAPAAPASAPSAPAG